MHLMNFVNTWWPWKNGWHFADNNTLMPNRRQVIIWTNGHLNYWHIYMNLFCWPIYDNQQSATTTLLWISTKFLAATKQLYERYFLSVRLSVCLSHLFDYVPIIVSSWNFQELLPMTKVTSMQKFKVRGQRSRSQRSQPNLTVSGL